MWNKPEQGNRSFTKRFGVLSLLAVREASYYLITQVCKLITTLTSICVKANELKYTCLVLSFVILDFPKTPLALARMIFFPYPLSVWFFIIRSVLKSPYNACPCVHLIFSSNITIRTDRDIVLCACLELWLSPGAFGPSSSTYGWWFIFLSSTRFILS